MRGFLCQLRMRKETEDAQTVIEADDYDPLSGECAAIVNGHLPRTHEEGAAIDPDNHRPVFVSRFRWGPHIEIEAIFTEWRIGQELMSVGALGPHDLFCMQPAPKESALRTPFQFAGGWGSRQRRSPTGGAA